jgi:hypothetical protein
VDALLRGLGREVMVASEKQLHQLPIPQQGRDLLANARARSFGGLDSA